MIIRVCEENLQSAAEIHAESWRASHASFCSVEFVMRHTVAHQRAYLEEEMQAGKRLYMLIKEMPVGIVSIQDSLIENLYVLPAEQRKGYGTELLLFALEQCRNVPRLWVLDNNAEAQKLYRRFGFRMTGKANQLAPGLSELEMAKEI